MKKGKLSQKIISYKLQFDRERFMATSQSG